MIDEPISLYIIPIINYISIQEDDDDLNYINDYERIDQEKNKNNYQTNN